MNVDAAELAVLKSCQLLKQLPDEVFQKLIDISQIITYQKDDQLLTEGEDSDHLFIIIVGSVSLYKATNQSLRRMITTLGVGDSIGEMRILKNQPCSLSVKANETTKVLVTSISAMRAERYHESHYLLTAIIEIMNTRIIKTNHNILERINEKLKKMKQLYLAIFAIIVISLFLTEVALAMYYVTNTNSFCDFQNKLTGTENYQGQHF